MRVGMALSMLNHKRALENDRMMMTAEADRMRNYYASSWLDHKGKGVTDLYPLPWEYEQKDSVDVDTAHAAALELQRRLNEKNAIKE